MSCKLCTMILFSGNEINKLFYYNFQTNCSLFYEKNSPLWTQEISSLNDCETRKLQAPEKVRETWRETRAPLWRLIGPIIFLASEKNSFAILIGPIIFFTRKNIACFSDWLEFIRVLFSMYKVIHYIMARKRDNWKTHVLFKTWNKGHPCYSHVINLAFCSTNTLQWDSLLFHWWLHNK